MNFLDLLILRLIGYPQSGWIDLKQTKMTKLDFLYRLTTSKAALKNITLIPGETYYFFLNQLSSQLNLSRKNLRLYYNTFAYKKDGNILADTYKLPIGMDEKELILYLFKYSDKKYKEFSTKIFGMYNKEKWYYYIIIASIIQKEAASNKEMPLISSVIYNRLERRLPLQMDGTLNYGKYSHTKITAKKIKTDTTTYNTYKHIGLPVHPISAVSLNTIKHAIFPEKTHYLYFVKDTLTNQHIFSQTYKEHRENIKNNIRKNKNMHQLWKNIN